MGWGGCIQEKVVLKINQGRWAAIEKKALAHVPVDGRVTDLSHCTVVPPLSDCCVQMALSGTIDPKERKQQRTAEYTAVKTLINRHVGDFLVMVFLPSKTVASSKPAFWTPFLLALNTLEKEHGYRQNRNNVNNLDDCSLAQQLKHVCQPKSNGIKIALGTNSGMNGILHGESMVSELKLLIKAGNSLSEAIQCATQHNAELLGNDNILGAIAVGKPAHFLVTRGTPAQLPRKLSCLEAIYMNGEPCEKEYFCKV